VKTKSFNTISPKDVHFKSANPEDKNEKIIKNAHIWAYYNQKAGVNKNIKYGKISEKIQRRNWVSPDDLIFRGEQKINWSFNFRINRFDCNSRS